MPFCGHTIMKMYKILLIHVSVPAIFKYVLTTLKNKAQNAWSSSVILMSYSHELYKI